MTENRPPDTIVLSHKPRVFRVRNLPGHVDRLSAVELLCATIKGITTQDVQISSLAYDVDPWAWSRAKVATLTFEREPPDLSLSLKGGEYSFSVSGLEKPLIIDHHFQGITPLNQVPDYEHKFDCLIISGLASHPFGSWQPHGYDKSFMWIRDELPQRLPGVRFLVYGYDTTLSGSKSFQAIQDLAISLVQTVKAIGWSAPSAKPVLFLAHSLGGVILKNALIIMAGGDHQEREILAKVKGAVFFGVPSQGMDMGDIFQMLGDQPNADLVKGLSNQSNLLPRLDEQFGNISYLQRLQFFWAFETKVTPTVEKAHTSGKFARTGPGTVMVSRESATRNLCHSQPSSTIQIDENHSDMVKFVVGDHSIGILASKLESICAVSETANPTVPLNTQEDSGQRHGLRRSEPQSEWTEPGFWNDDAILSSLRAPERDRRLEQINQQLGDTLNWAYDDTSVGLSEWLQKGTGIFWINGKPASGKSTLMKYLHQDPRTHELLRSGCWRSKGRLTTASFFFHHRGNNMQKSFEGLLRSLVSQILEQESTLFRLIYPLLAEQYRTLIVSEGLDNLETDIWALLDRSGVPRSYRVTNEVEKTIGLQRELTQSRQIGLHLQRMLEDLGVELDSNTKIPLQNQMFDDVPAILKTKIGSESNQKQGTTNQWPGSTRWTPTLIGILNRHYQREKIRMDIQAGQWSIKDLEDGLSRLVGQSLFKMDLFLFLDALDEYNGRPEFIASFVQHLVQQSADPSTISLTRIRILFSSRPWKALCDEFAACPGFQIHDHTWNDIIEFCAASIPSDDTAKVFLSPFVMEIVSRARGVFLWVELVMRDLTQTVLQRLQLRDTQGLEGELRKTLDGIPDELDDYYHVIVQRIPAGTRWESYVVLETLCRSEQDIDIQTLLAILQCWSAKSFTDAQRKIIHSSRTPLQGAPLEQAERYIKAVSGGLVEVGGISVEGKPIVQFMHQTVKQFVMGPWFKFHLLGNRSMLTAENGHCFISKYLFVDLRIEDSFFHHAREAEITTGFSQYDFFSTAPTDHCIYRDPHEARSLIAMAVSAGLQLYIRDAYEADRSCVRQNSEEIILVLVKAIQERPTVSMLVEEVHEMVEEVHERQTEEEIDSILDTARMLITMGLSLSIDGSDCTLTRLTKGLWNGHRRLTSVMEDLAIILVGAIPRPRPSTEAPFSQRESNLKPKFGTKALHHSTPKLVQALLSRGVDPNWLDDHGNTPIDSVLAWESPPELDRREILIDQYEIVSQLVYHGGVLFSTRRSQWKKWESMCAGSGLDITIFREAGFPLWVLDQYFGRRPSQPAQHAESSQPAQHAEPSQPAQHAEPAQAARGHRRLRDFLTHLVRFRTERARETWADHKQWAPKTR